MKQVYQQPTEHALAQPAFQMQQPQGYAQAQTQSEYQMQQPEAYQPTSSQLQQQPMLYSPQQMQTPATTASVAPQEELQQPLGSGDVPVVNINLPAGQRLAPGQYAMDGDLVPDQGQAGAYDFVGNLVPQQQPGNADPAYARHAL